MIGIIFIILTLYGLWFALWIPYITMTNDNKY